MFTKSTHVTVSICTTSYQIKAFTAKLNSFKTRFCYTLAKNYFDKQTELEAVRALTYS